MLLILAFAVPLLVWTRLDHPYRDAKFILIWIAAALVWGLHATSRKVTRFGGEPWLILYLIVMAESVRGAVAVGRGTHYFLEQAALLSLLPLSAWAFSTPRALERLWSVILCAVLIVGAIGKLQSIGIDPIGLPRAYGYPHSSLGYKNLAGQVYLLGAIVAAGCLVSRRSSAVLTGAALMFSAWGLWSVRARSCAAGAVLGLLLLLALLWRRRMLVRPRVSAAVGALLAVVLLSVPAPVIKAAYRSGPAPAPPRAISDVSTLEVRWTRWSNALAMWVEHPARGVGLGNFRVHYPAYGRSDPEQTAYMNIHEAHNEYLQVLCETGLLGLTALGALLVTLVLRLFQRRDVGASLSLAALVGVGAHTFFSFALRNPVPPTWLWLLVGASLSRPAQARSLILPRAASSAGAILLGILFLAWAAISYESSALLKSSRSAIKKRDFVKAEALLTRASLHPSADKALLKLCYVQGKLRKLDLATESCEAALARQPFNHIIHDQLARQLQKARRFDEAIEHYGRALETDPEFTRARRERDKLLRALGREQEGLKRPFR